MSRLLLLLLMLVPLIAEAGNLEIRTYTLFGGSNTDSLEQRSAWIPVFGANRVIIRTYTTHAAFSASGVDSAFSDSVTTFRMLFSDSISTFVNSRPVAADSFLVDPAVGNADSTTVGMFARSLPINKPLRAPSNGSGLITWVMPAVIAGIPGSATSVTVYGENNIPKQFMRITVTPLRRNTVSGNTSTQGIRVNGLKGLKMIAYVVYINK